MGNTDVVNVEIAHIIRDVSDLNRRLCEMEKVIVDLRIGIAKIVFIGALSTAVVTPVLSAIVIKVIFKV